eukprot:7044502-Ditylum_brightwellii.AAC.1
MSMLCIVGRYIGRQGEHNDVKILEQNEQHTANIVLLKHDLLLVIVVAVNDNFVTVHVGEIGDG